jgi:Zn-dependent M28 family amino/carboxypeptidase
MGLLLSLVGVLMAASPETVAGRAEKGEVMTSGTDFHEIKERLTAHLAFLTRTIGERSVRVPENLARARDYISQCLADAGLNVHLEPYVYGDMEVANVVAEMAFSGTPAKHYVVGAHYDSVAGTVGADDNASAVAVLLELARRLKSLAGQETLDLAVTLVSFALEEPPVFSTRFMGSRVYAEKARREKRAIDGMICLEMVGYRCREQGCQGYPFPLMFLGYPKEGDFIGLVGNFRSRPLTQNLYRAFTRNPRLPVVKLSVPFSGWLVPAVRLSDHASFWDEGFRAVMVTDSAFYRNPHYHTPSDTMDKLDFELMAEVVESLLLFFTSQ